MIAISRVQPRWEVLFAWWPVCGTPADGSNQYRMDRGQLIETHHGNDRALGWPLEFNLRPGQKTTHSTRGTVPIVRSFDFSWKIPAGNNWNSGTNCEGLEIPSQHGCGVLWMTTPIIGYYWLMCTTVGRSCTSDCNLLCPMIANSG